MDKIDPSDTLFFELQTCLKVRFEKAVHYIEVNYLSVGEAASFQRFWKFQKQVSPF